MRYFGSLSYEHQSDLVDEISSEIQRYRALVDLLLYVQDDEMMQIEAEKFNSYLELFSYGEAEEEPTEEDLIKQFIEDSDSADSDTISNE